MIELRDITPDNHLEVRSLSVHPEQTRFVADVDKSLADAFVWRDALARAAYHQGAAVGFVMIFPYSEAGVSHVNIVRLMIAAEHQGIGLGRQLLAETLLWIDALSPDRIRISTLPDNETALRLYRSFGFVENGVEDGEIALYLDKTET